MAQKAVHCQSWPAAMARSDSSFFQAPPPNRSHEGGLLVGGIKQCQVAAVVDLNIPLADACNWLFNRTSISANSC